ncbi:dephospho-CoA kinase, partial [candidate division WOR-3 bacterium]|nr:dephospho-CoA kinase [candidate division WOR-3 bacterium]
FVTWWLCGSSLIFNFLFNYMVVGITGRIGSGKTEVAQIFKKNGFTSVDVDRMGHKLLERDDIKKSIIDTFGNLPFIEGSIDRKHLGEIVLTNKDKIKIYDSIIHPPLIQELRNLIKKQGKTSLLAVDCALIFEWGVEELFDYIILVKSDEEKCIQRAVKNGKSEKFVRRILSVQLTDEKRLEKVDFIIENNNGLSELQKKTMNIITSLLFSNK